MNIQSLFQIGKSLNTHKTLTHFAPVHPLFFLTAWPQTAQ